MIFFGISLSLVFGLLLLGSVYGIQESFATEPCEETSAKDAWDGYDQIYHYTITSKIVYDDSIFIEYFINEVIKGELSEIPLSKSVPIFFGGWEKDPDGYKIGEQYVSIEPYQNTCVINEDNTRGSYMDYVNQQRELPTPKQQENVKFENFECKFDLLPIIKTDDTFDCVSEDTKELLSKQDSLIEFDYYKLLNKSVQLESFIIHYWSSTEKTLPIEYGKSKYSHYEYLRFQIDSDIKGRFLIAVPTSGFEIGGVAENNLYAKKIHQDKTNAIYEINFLTGKSNFYLHLYPIEDENPKKIPDWIKNNALWWSEGLIDDDTFKKGIQFMIKEDIIPIDDLPKTVDESEDKIPDWIKNNALWWADNILGEDDFVKGLKYMIEKGIIRID